MGLIAVSVVTFVLAWGGLHQAILSLAFDPILALSKPWTFLTFVISNAGDGRSAFWFILGLLWLWSFGVPIERQEGMKRYALVLIGSTLAVSLSYWLGTLILRPEAVQFLFGTTLTTSCITVIWCARNPNQTIMLMGLVPIQGKFLALFVGILDIMSLGTGSPLLGIFIAIPLVAAWFYGMRPVAASYGSNRMTRAEQKARDRREQAFLDSVKDREKEREEREKLRRLFESSLRDDDDAASR